MFNILHNYNFELSNALIKMLYNILLNNIALFKYQIYLLNAKLLSNLNIRIENRTFYGNLIY